MVTDARLATTAPPAGTTPHISVIICTRNRPDDVTTCLPTVLACDYPNFDVFLVDQSTDEATGRVVDSLRTTYPPVHYQRTTTVGKTRALNIALREATGELLAFTDDDCETPVGWLQAIAGAFAGDPQADILFGPVVPSPALDGLPDICVPAWDFTEARPRRSQRDLRHGREHGVPPLAARSSAGRRVIRPAHGTGHSLSRRGRG